MDAGFKRRFETGLSPWPGYYTPGDGIVWRKPDNFGGLMFPTLYPNPENPKTSGNRFQAVPGGTNGNDYTVSWEFEHNVSLAPNGE